MGTAYAPAVAAQPSAKCKICGHRAARGSRLCSQCNAAVKRARQVPTVMSQFMPMALSGYGSAGGSVAQHQTVRFRNVPPRPAPARTIGWGALVAFAAFTAAVCVTAYFATLEIDETPTPAPVAVASVPNKATNVTMSAIPAATLAAEAIDAPVHADAGQLADGTSPAETQAKPAIRRSAVAAPARNASPTIPAGLSMTASDPNADSTPSEGAAAPLPPAPVAVPQEPLVPDRWQTMNEEIARCPRENFFVGVVCEQRVRLRYCDGYWGSVPHCGGGFRFDNGR